MALRVGRGRQAPTHGEYLTERTVGPIFGVHRMGLIPLVVAFVFSDVPRDTDGMRTMSMERF
jgi:hypothetical protein